MPISRFFSGLCLSFILSASCLAQGKIHSVRYEPSTKPGELIFGVTYRVWIPDSAKQVRGVIVHQHGCGKGACQGGRTAADDLHWQALAEKWQFALLGPSFEQEDGQNCRMWCDPRNGSRTRFLQALDDLSKASGHPELATAPWCLWGHSGGAFWSSLMMISDPQRIAAVWLRSGTGFTAWEKGEIPRPEIPAATYKIPTMCNPGLKERDDKRFSGAWTGAMAMFQAYRGQGAPIGFAPDPQTSHECGDSRYMAIPFFDACLKQRLAPDGNLREITDSASWLATDWESAAVAVNQFKGAIKTSVWLPDADFAKIWHAYITRQKVIDDTPPPSPHSITITARTDGGRKLEWKNKADFESGLAGFEIFKDGKLVGTIPEKPSGQFGRPLFQGMSYHDTPREPVSVMEFIDKSPSGGAYEIRSVNTAGLKSKMTGIK